MKKGQIVKLAVSAITMAMLTGCGGGSMYWYNAQKDLKGAKLDKFQCEESAATYCKDMDKAGDKDLFAKRLQECMEVRGYAKLPEKDLPEGAPQVK